MLEFYQAYAEGEDLMRPDRGDAFGLGARGRPEARRPLGGGDDRLDAAVPPPDDAEAVVEFTRGDPRGPVTPGTLESPEQAPRGGRSASASTARSAFRGQKGKLLAELFEAVAERSSSQPTFLHEFPTEISPLSRQKPGDPEWADRFELYAGGMEIANGFSELNDPAEQAERFRRQAEDRRRGDLEAAPLRRGLRRGARVRASADGGEGVGIDRLDDAADGPAFDQRRDPLSASPARSREAGTENGKRSSAGSFPFPVLLPSHELRILRRPSLPRLRRAGARTSR